LSKEVNQYSCELTFFGSAFPPTLEKKQPIFDFSTTPNEYTAKNLLLFITKSSAKSSKPNNVDKRLFSNTYQQQSFSSVPLINNTVQAYATPNRPKLGKSLPGT
jgi:hypothetical protein